MFKIKDFIELIRVRQWYKNIVIFIPLLFSLNFFDIKLFFLTLAGFFVLCFASSSAYIINDILDIEKDKYHPEKKNKPLVSKKIKIPAALIISLILLNLSFLASYLMSFSFFLIVFLLFVFLQIYNFYIRGVAFLDLIFISINFAVRSISGIFIIGYPVSPWVILSAFFLSLFLVSGKRSAELSLQNIKKYRPNFKDSDKGVLEFLSIMAITCVFVFFSIYSVLFERQWILLSLPLALYITLLFFHELHNTPINIRNPEKFIFNKKIILSMILWLVIIIVSLYIFT